MRAFGKPARGLVLFFVVLCALVSPQAWAIKSASIVICAETGKVYSSSNPDVKTPPASLTKMMTLYLVFKALRERKLTFQTKIPVSRHAERQTPCKLWLKKGSFITVHQAILGAVTKSANDASVALAEALGKGSEAHFAKLMTQQARKLGMTSTVFGNASGLPHKLNMTTARDMATLSRALYRHFPEYFKFFKEKQFVYKGTTHKNHNHLLGKVPGVDGIKTGFVCASGFNLAASMVRGNRRIIAVVLGGESIKARDKKMTKLLETTYASLTGMPAGAPERKERYASIGDLIHTLGASDRTSPKTQKAVYLSHTGDVQPLKKKYDSLDSLFKVIEKPAATESKPAVKAKSKKKPSKAKKNSSKPKKKLSKPKKTPPKSKKKKKTAS